MNLVIDLQDYAKQMVLKIFEHLHSYPWIVRVNAKSSQASLNLWTTEAIDF